MSPLPLLSSGPRVLLPASLSPLLPAAMCVPPHTLFSLMAFLVAELQVSVGSTPGGSTEKQASGGLSGHKRLSKHSVKENLTENVPTDLLFIRL